MLTISRNPKPTKYTQRLALKIIRDSQNPALRLAKSMMVRGYSTLKRFLFLLSKKSKNILTQFQDLAVSS